MFPRSDPSRVCALRDVERQRAPVAVSPSTVHRPLARPRNVTLLKWAGHSRRSPGRNVYRYVIPVSQKSPNDFGTRAPHDSLTIVTLDPNRSWQGINSDTGPENHQVAWRAIRPLTDGSSLFLRFSGLCRCHNAAQGRQTVAVAQTQGRSRAFDVSRDSRRTRHIATASGVERRRSTRDLIAIFPVGNNIPPDSLSPEFNGGERSHDSQTTRFATFF